jgi:predicted esterase
MGRRGTITRWCAQALWWSAMVATPAAGQDAAASAGDGSSAVTRADLAARYLLMDRAYARADSAGRLTDSTRMAANRLFDRATVSFFSGRLAVTAAMMDTAIGMIDASYRYARTAVPRAIIDGKPARVTREALLQRITKLDSGGALAQPIASAAARARLLVDTISPERSAEFLSNPALLAKAVREEVSALERGRNPYAGHAGDLWRVYKGARGALVPMRVVAPATAATTPAGVLIALHGFGGDENMFADGYGQGITARLARENGLLFVSPSTNVLQADPVHFDSLLAVLTREYRVDASRVYVIGHSMGAGVAARLAQDRPLAIAAAVCIAGGSAVTGASAPPMLFIGAALDPVSPAARVKAAATGTPTANYEERAHEGHTLVVRAGVLRGVPWLLQHTRTR